MHPVHHESFMSPVGDLFIFTSLSVALTITIRTGSVSGVLQIIGRPYVKRASWSRAPMLAGVHPAAMSLNKVLSLKAMPSLLSLCQDKGIQNRSSPHKTTATYLSYFLVVSSLYSDFTFCTSKTERTILRQNEWSLKVFNDLNIFCCGSTLAGGPADQAGLQQLDTLLQLNGQPVEQWKCVDLAHAIR